VTGVAARQVADLPEVTCTVMWAGEVLTGVVNDRRIAGVVAR
jgi:hypothetical protein